MKLVSLLCCAVRSRFSGTLGRFALTVVIFVFMLCFGGRQGLAHPENSEKLWSHSRVLEYEGNECEALTTDTCETVTSDPVTVPGVGPVRITLQCPSALPNLVGWDTQQNEFLSVVVTSPDPRIGLAGAISLTVSVTNIAAEDDENVAGNVQLYIGCSQFPWNGTPFATERRGLPSLGILLGASQEESTNGGN
jgi:hypothetical protein